METFTEHTYSATGIYRESGQAVSYASTSGEPEVWNLARTEAIPDMQVKESEAFIEEASLLVDEIVGTESSSYKESRKTVQRLLKKSAKDLLNFPIVSDAQAEKLLATVELIAKSKAKENKENAELILRSGRHLCEHLSELLLDRHLRYLGQVLKRPDERLPELINRLSDSTPHVVEIAKERLARRIEVYLSVESFLHPPELDLSVAKVRSRAGARSRRGNLWPTERKEKTLFLEGLADAGKVEPAFTEEDIDFLVSQSSMEMLRCKVDLLESEEEQITPNRLKANYSRLQKRIERSKTRRENIEQRKELLRELGATPEQIDYISARASYETMENLLQLSDSELAVSDLMGGKRAIRKILRRQGRVPSQSEIELAKYMVDEEGISPEIAEAYAHSRKNHNIDHLRQTIQFLKQQYARFYKKHWGFDVSPSVLHRALEKGLSRSRLDKRSLSERDFLYDLREAVSLEEKKIVSQYGPLDIQKRREALYPLREVLDYESDSWTKEQLLFICEQFIQFGLCISREQLKEICLKNKELFPTSRKFQDAIEILNGSYRAIAQHGEEICVSPDYLDVDSSSEN